jgi:uncharacterized membrane protein
MVANAPHLTPDSADRDRLLRTAELVISNVLRGGVILSAAVVLLGVVMYYWRYFTGAPTSHTEGAFPHSLSAVVHGLAAGNPQAVVALGLLLLLITPVLRVAVSIVAFALERDWRYTAITALVLLILIASFLSGRGGA